MSRKGLVMTEEQLAAHNARFRTQFLGEKFAAPRGQPRSARGGTPAVAANPADTFSAILPERKYRNVPTLVNGITFASRKEAKTYAGLLLLEQKGDIRGLELQQPFSIDINSVHVCDYIADFVFWRGDKRVVMDTKGVRTPAFRMKAKLMTALYGVVVEEV